MARPETRPPSDASLETARRSGRGRLKIFLGAAPGVGKTYEMLTSAQAKRRDGVEVAIGVVETHGRAETEALIAGLETIPRRTISYKGQSLTEMDLDEILRRRPALVLVDELAHTNAPGSRHPKRYLDVEELIAAGIDVYTTLNIQHVESLNDVVAKITRIRVRETVPDGVLDSADDIEIIDLAPEDLLKRLREGKVYVPHQAERAVRHFFSPGNLTALRELALRRTAQRVDAQLLSHMQEHEIAGPWAASDRILVCVSDAAETASLIRYGRRVADRLRVPWTALHVEAGHGQRLGAAQRDRIADHLRLAERLGAVTISIPGRNVADEIVAYARVNNITQIIIGKSARSRWFEILHGSVVHELVRKAGQISVHVISGDRGGEPASGQHPALPEPAPPLRTAPFLGSAALVAAAMGVGLLIQRFIPVQSISMIFLIAVLGSAVAWGLWPSLAACLMSMLAYNFFFMPPLYTLTITDPENVLTLFFFLIVAVIVSNLTAATRRQAITARAQAKTTAELYAFSRKLAAIGTLDDLLWATAYQISSMLKVRTVFLMPQGEGMVVSGSYPPEDEIDAADMAAARWSWAHNRPAGHGADTLPGGKRLFLPLETGSGPVGIIGIDSDRNGAVLTPDGRRLLDALAGQTAIAIERIALAKGLDEARMLAESERLRSALLTSISHDLRTPLASIVGTATSLRSFGASYSAAERDELLANLEEEAERLGRFVGNLLDMTRLESGAVAPRLELADTPEIVDSALRRASAILARHTVTTDLAPDLPPLELDPLLLEQALFNLLDNAAKYAPSGSRIEIRAARRGAAVEISVRDEGPGIPAEDLERVFGKFFRVQAQDRQRAGTGLGLAICRGFVEAMGGTIIARNRTDRRGLEMTISLPVPAQAAAPVEAMHA